MANISYCILSIIYCIILMVVYYCKKKIKSVENSIYSILLFVTFAGLLIELFIYLLLKIGIDYSFPVYYMMNKGMLIYYIMWIYIFTLYTFFLSKKDKDSIIKNKKKLYFVGAVLTIICIILPMKIVSINALLIPTGISVMYTYSLSAICIVLMIIFMILDRKNIKMKKYYPLYCLLVFGSICMIIQFFYPELLLLNPVQVIVCFIMFFTIENPDVKMIEQLEIVREQADKANQAKTDFLSSMSHEIRTPLNAIVGFSECINESETLDEAKDNAKDIVSASKTLLEIVNGILDISKIEAGMLEIVNSPYDAHELFEGLAKLIKPKMDEKALDFTYYIAPDLPPTLYGDHANLKKVVTNLLSNASKYTDKGFVRYEVNCIRNIDECKLIISVEDSGRGIKKDSIDKLFTKFQRLEEDRNTTIEGTGLGLAITKQLVELMGGKIIVHTVYGEGSKFTIVLTQKIEKTIETEDAPKIKTTLDLKDKKILLVDDNALNIKVATKLLERYNANNVTSVDNGFDCIEKITSGEKYDVILLDDMMTKMSGIETLHKLKEISNFNTPVVALTANAITGMREKYINEGFDDYLAKPIEKDQLIIVLNKLLDIPITEEYKNLPQQIEETIQNKKSSPEEEIEIIGEEKINTNTPEEFLKNNGVDIDKALELLRDMEMYNMTM